MQRHITSTEIKYLASKVYEPAVSIYINFRDELPSPIQDQAKLESMVREAFSTIQNKFQKVDLDEMFLPIRALMRQQEFWDTRTYGAAFFIAQDFFSWCSVANIDENLVIVNDKFHIVPLLNEINESGDYHILALSKKRPRLLTVGSDSIKHHKSDQMPDSLEVIRIAERAVERNTIPSNTIDTLTTYIKMIDRSAQQILIKNKLPLVVVGLPQMQSIYGKVSSYRLRVREGLQLNPDSFSNFELRQLTWPIVLKVIDDNKLSYTLGRVKIKNKSHSIREIVQAAFDGRVDTLLIQKGAHAWGRINTAKHGLESHNKQKMLDTDLLNLAAVEALRFRGRVVEVDDKKATNGYSTMAVMRY